MAKKMRHTGLEVLSEVTMKIILLRDMTIIFLVDICHRLRTTGWLYLLGIRKKILWYKIRGGGLIRNNSTFQHKTGFVTTQNKDSVRNHGIFYTKKKLIDFSRFLVTVIQHACKWHNFAYLSSIVYYGVKRAYYMPMPLSENISLLI